VEDGSDDSADVALPFGEVEVAIFGVAYPFGLGRCVDTALLALSLA
jgi:hypothetical protein